MSALRSTYRRIRRAVRRAVGQDVQFPVQVVIPAQRHGSDYGGWWISPDGLGPGAVVYSAGVGTDITFDLSMIETFGMAIHAFDPTPGSVAYLERQSLPPGFKLHPLGLASYDGPARFLPPADPAHISHTLLARDQADNRAIDVDVRRLSTIMRELGHPAIDLLKMDIEGAEYDVLEEILESRLAVRQILVEFHHRFPGIGVARTRRAVEQLNAAGYRIFFAAENGEEYSFILEDDLVPELPADGRRP